MFQINMLNGRQLPKKHWPGVVLTGIAFVIPVAVALTISIGYFNDRAALNVQQEKPADYDLQLRAMGDGNKRVDGVVSGIQKISTSLPDAATVLVRHTHWRDILLAISENLPDTLFVNKLDVMRRTAARAVDQRYGDKKKINILIPARILVVSLYSSSGAGDDEAVRNFQRSLIETEAFQRCVKDVVIAMREPDSLEGKDIVRYELNCILGSTPIKLVDE
ncbi:MAG: hypothetical protein FVQ82_06610 [Planctomycetes bacterium]|nr:hypothetical protein [Planctomycetota bacterium]